jgi:hypothetical protein
MEIWMICVELAAKTGGENAPSEIGFMNIATWADSKETAVGKIQRYLESLDWQLVSVEQAHIVNEDSEHYGDVELDQIGRTLNNPDAIILGTFHTYKTN